MNPTFLEFRIHGMDCAEEIAILKRELGSLVPSEDHLSFDILNAKMIVQPGESQISADVIMEAVNRTGMKAEVWEDYAEETTANFWERYGRTILTAVSGICGLLGFCIHVWTAGGLLPALGSEGMGVAHSVPPLAIAFYLAAILSGIWLVIPKAWHSAISLRPDMNLLMTIAVIGAAAIGEWFEAATVAFLFSVSLLLESWSVGRARRAIAALMDLTPPVARIRSNDGSMKEVAPDDVAVGDIFVVRPAEKIPLDGIVTEGNSDVNQAPITGESVPVDKRPGSELFAGTINGDGVLEAKCTKLATDTTLASIIRMVGEAQSRRAPSEKWVEKFARVYTPAIMALALTILVVPPLLFSGQWSNWLYRSLVLLVIACPCALVISTPVSVVAGLAAAARNGVLIKGGVFIKVGFRLANWRTIHADDTNAANDTVGTLKKIGCEVRQSNHGGHVDISFRCPSWKTISVQSDEQSKKWNQWLTNNEFETVILNPAKDAKLPTVRLRMTTRKTIHARSAEQAQALKETYELIGCEVKINNHGNHIDVSFHCPKWNTIALPNSKVAHVWQDWLKKSGFETEHDHSNDSHGSHAGHNHAHQKTQGHRDSGHKHDHDH